MFQGALFTRDWLKEGITETSEWRGLGKDQLEALWEEARALLIDHCGRRKPTEAETEDQLIYPLLELLGWKHKSVQQNMTTKGRKDVPDALLFADAESDERAKMLEPWQRFRHGAALVEAKRWNRALDREGPAEQGIPSTQIMHYLRRAAVVADGKMPWGILTNGRHWRLYYQNALSVAEDFFEIDLGKVFALPGCNPDLLDEPIEPAHAFRLFALIFGRDAFLPSEQGRSFHLIAIEEARRWEEKVRKDLADTVFDTVFPELITAIPLADPARPAVLDEHYADEVRQTAMFLLYRLLFVLYAEDRNLLPDERGPYAEYSLTRLRQEIAEKATAKQSLQARSFISWSRLEIIFDAISRGNDDLGIPPYNGGLFASEGNPLLGRIKLSDATLAKVILPLSHREEDGRLRYINYRDLSVQQLGSIYESILEYGVEIDSGGSVRPRSDNEARHRSGSYYTPEPLVSLIIEKTVGPLVEERRQAFVAAVESGAKGADLSALDPAMSLLSLRIVDPAMGSGHFLVSLVDWLSDKVLTAIGEAENLVEGGYASPLVARIVELRDGIVANAREHGWPIVEEQLDDRHIVRRMVLKRCVHGVDLNPMAVELAKVALWLHSFTVGAPLSFLDHHLRCGNSVIGAWVRPTMDWMQQRGALISNRHLASISNVVRNMEEIEGLTDTDITQVDQSKTLFAAIAETSAPLEAVLSLAKADDLMGVLEANVRRPRETAAAIRTDGDKRLAVMKDGPAKDKETAKIERAVTNAREAERKFDRAEAMKLVHEGTFGDPSRIASGEIEVLEAGARTELGFGEPEPIQGSLMPSHRPDDRRRALADQLVREARAIAAEQRFFHWEVAFPGVWGNLSSASHSGGFDAVIGNPPYVRQEEISAIKPALAKAFDTFTGTADLYVYFYEQGIKLLKPGGRMGYVVTNKWLKAGYAEKLRRMFAEDVWIEFLADFGHARHLFPDADVFPCVITVRKPDAGAVPELYDLAVIPRNEVPREGLAAAVQAATYRAGRAELTEEAWVLEPPEVAALLRKIRERGVPLEDYAGVSPLYGIKTGFNEAFLIDTATRDRLVREDPAAAEIIRPYLRGQDIGRWLPEWAGLWMIVMKSSGDHAWPWANAAGEAEAEAIFAQTYPSIYQRFKALESFKKEGKDKGLRHREDQGKFWWELRPCAYYANMDGPKIVYTEITWSNSFAFDEGNHFINNTAYVLPSNDHWIPSVLNSPLMWWYSWRKAQHGKDEALRFMDSFIRPFPFAPVYPEDRNEAEERSAQMRIKLDGVRHADVSVADWIAHTFDPKTIPPTLREASKLDSDGFIAAVRAALPKRQGLTPTQLRQLRDAFAETAEPARAARNELMAHERKIAAMVERAYGFTQEEVALMWRTAPPRMPLAPLV
ncbi:MAG: Eco57I restriction-modification methylase domain-containing protein [Sphingorhabdus sp.]